jgi:Gnt-I system high-affinity gluconate transporter
VIAAGGAFKQVLVDSGLGKDLAAQFIHFSASPLVIAWAIATLLRIAVGSATVAGMTAAGIVQPLILSSGASPELMTLAVGAGSLMCSHVNDTGFWMFREWFGLSLKGHVSILDRDGNDCGTGGFGGGSCYWIMLLSGYLNRFQGCNFYL